MSKGFGLNPKSNNLKAIFINFKSIIMYRILKNISFSLCFLSIFCLNLQAQKAKPDLRLPLQKEDGNNMYRSNEITELDLLHALDFMGVRIQKFKLGRFDQKYKLHIFAETYEKGEIVKTDTLLADDNQYHFFERGETNYFLDYIDQLKFITKSEDNRSEIRLHTYKLSTKTEIELKKWDDRQFYNWRFFTDAHWELNKKIPLMVFASSWKDKRYDFHRFCGVVNLKEGEEGTEELLEESPTYVMFSYQVSLID